MKFNTERLLTTAEAARMLRVSQASVRRWSDSGLLRAKRVGRRGERRFSESDLVLFLDRGTETQRHEPSAESMNVGGVQLTVPSHAAALYSTDGARLRLSLPFLADGLRVGQRCLLAATGSIKDLYLDALSQQRGINLDEAMRDEQFAVVEFQDGTAPGAIAQWEEGFAKILAQKASVIRIVGEMRVERTMFRSEDEMLRYEELFEVMHKRYPVAVICQYDVRGFDGIALLRALKAHPGQFGQRTGAFLN